MTETKQTINPLKQYFRTFSIYIKLPSGTTYYKPEQIEFNADGEIGIMAMTGKDELTLRNPDALLNGEAIIEIINSCVPHIKDAKALLVNDIDAIFTAIRLATFKDSLETEINCPKCNHNNTYKLNLEYVLDNMSFLEKDYVINLDSGLSVFVKPYSFPEMLKALKSTFEKSKIARTIEANTLDDDARHNIFANAFKEIAVTKFDLTSSAIIRIVDESNNIDVTDKKYILDFLQNIDTISVDKIANQINELNKIGIKKTFNAVCGNCRHEWESEIDFNPVNFL